MRSGTNIKRNMCVGCNEPFGNGRLGARHSCTFAETGFQINGVQFPPCHSRYHPKCIKAGLPFQSRLKDVQGLSFPHHVSFPMFVCELCSVQANVGRKLGGTPRDIELILLERVRMIDCANAWANDTLKVYGSALRWVEKFQEQYKAPILPLYKIHQPPISRAIPLAWAELAYSLRKVQNKQGQLLQVKYGTVARLRSAVGWYHAYAMVQAYPERLIRDKNHRQLVIESVSPSDEAMTSLFHAGLGRRIGTDVTPCWALSHVHISYIDNHLNQLYVKATSSIQKHDLACAGTINLKAYLGWLRSREVFGVDPSDVNLILPQKGPTRGLPMNIGAVELRLLEATKSDQSQTADIIIAFTTLSGLSLGKWLLRLQQFKPPLPHKLFSTPTCKEWSSAYFRNHYVYPILEMQRRAGEPTLQCFSDIPGHRIQDKINSMHAWRRGGRTKVSRFPKENEPKPPGYRKATKDEIHNHGRWAYPRNQEEIAHQYNQWDLQDRIAITLFCM